MADSKEYILRFFADRWETVRELVRCKECKHKHIKDNVWTCPFGLPSGCDFYCGHGERKTE